MFTEPKPSGLTQRPVILSVPGYSVKCPNVNVRLVAPHFPLKASLLVALRYRVVMRQRAASCAAELSRLPHPVPDQLPANCERVSLAVLCARLSENNMLIMRNNSIPKISRREIKGREKPKNSLKVTAPCLPFSQLDVQNRYASQYTIYEYLRILHLTICQ